MVLEGCWNSSVYILHVRFTCGDFAVWGVSVCGLVQSNEWDTPMIPHSPRKLVQAKKGGFSSAKVSLQGTLTLG